MTTDRWVWRDVHTGDRVCLLTTPHRCTLGRHLAPPAPRPSLLRQLWQRVTA